MVPDDGTDPDAVESLNNLFYRNNPSVPVFQENFVLDTSEVFDVYLSVESVGHDVFDRHAFVDHSEPFWNLDTSVGLDAFLD